MYVLVVLVMLMPLGGKPYYQFQITVPSQVPEVVAEKDKNAECVLLMAELEKAFKRRFPSQADHIGMKCKRVLSGKVRVL